MVATHVLFGRPSKAHNGIGVANHEVVSLGKLTTVLLEHLDVGVKVVPGRTGLLRLDPRELNLDLVELNLVVGVHLHHGYRVD